MAARLKSWLVNGSLAIAAIALAGAASEAGIRMLAPQQTGLSHQDPYGLAMHWPGIERYLPQFGHTVSFNSQGMRDREHDVAKAQGVFRVLVLGDSFMEALQVPFEASLPSLLEGELARTTGKRVEVVNASMSGWGTDDELRYLTSYGEKWRPDLVLVAVTLHNDISDDLRQDWHALRGGELVEQPRARMSFTRYKIVELKGFIATHLQAYQLWRKVWHGREMRQIGQQLNSHIVELFREPTPASIARGFQLAELELAQIRDVTNAMGGRVAVVLLPLQVQLTDSAFGAFARSAGTSATAMRPDKPQDTMRRVAERLVVPAIDLLPTFRQWAANGGAPLYLQTDGHWNEAGHRLAAGAAAKGLVDAGMIK